MTLLAPGYSTSGSRTLVADVWAHPSARRSTLIPGRGTHRVTHGAPTADGQLETTCGNAGTSLRQLLRARVQVTDPKLIPEFFAALRRVVPADPPAVSVVVTDTLTVEGASVAIDGVALVTS